MEAINYTNTHKSLYDDIALWEKKEGTSFFNKMPLGDNKSPIILDFGYGFGQYLLASAYAFPEGMVYGIEANLVCQNEITKKIQLNSINNIKIINKTAENLQEFQANSIDLMLLYDILHGGNGVMKYMLFEEAQRIIKTGGCLSVLPFHLSNWRDKHGNKKKFTTKMIINEIIEYGFRYEGSCKTKGVHWEKCHTPYYIQKGNITFDMLEKMDVMNFIKV
ncbi:hypothetical protein acsn021_43680 [Anaerocolumna cellulosilytica]|uniref:tRNA (guanine(46)-N(7))-methyltransferase n=1 Tax=Anaerocolumna cellulosilytica TaxID=433286 RepID=A0A6S6R628_9FIRM|nr:methyltransferase domain-containing protein [Anaerocolumna cellulosilytica]MBB5195325.1 ubiquinone/menaquinone biosynthesis C-methylase UbiE [Anaerocolumna cellulosilytica]BCJ96799.1 hypothetical protein acsn021_43680 [Anaerocolumna cellulosilytica]